MDCKHCHTSWTGENLKTPECCPVCGMQMRDEKAAKKESFHAVWGNIEKDAFQKRPSQKQFDAAVAHYLQAAMENPAESVLLADFVRENTSYASQSQAIARLLERDDLPTEEEDFSDRFEDELLKAAAQKGQAWAIATLWKKLRMAKENGKETLASQLALEMEPLCEALNDQKLTLMTQAILAAFQKRYSHALPALIRSLTRGEKGRLVIEDMKMRAQYTGLSDDFESRMEDIARALQAEDDWSLFEGLVRPLDHTQNAFAHLDHPDLRWAEYIEGHWDSILPLFESHIESRTALRGMHLLLNWLQNNAPSLKEACAKLLDAHFVQVYMKDYEEISATDWAWQIVPASADDTK